MRDKRRYIDIFAKQSPLRVVDHFVSAAIFVVLFVFFILAATGNRVIGSPDVTNAAPRTLTYLAVGGLYLLPYLFELTTKKRISDFVLTFFVVYVLLAGVIGGCFSVYYTLPGYDKTVHGVFGYVGCVIGLLVVCKLSCYDKLSPLFVAVVCFAVSMCAGALWEIIEFSGDVFLGQTSQGLPQIGENGELIRDAAYFGLPVVNRMDTMLDMTANFIGALVFELQFICNRLTKKDLILGAIIRDFTAESPSITVKFDE